MSLTPELEKAFNAQITMEYAAAYSYLGMSAWLERQGLPGMASWMRMQSDEEATHGLRLFQFVLDRGGNVELGRIDAPSVTLETPVDVFRASLAQEKDVTASINRLYSLVIESKDFSSIPLLDWFVAEQVEEESTVQQIIDDLERGGEGHTVLMLDRELGQRGTTVEA
ncbi:MAG: ferritin [Acidimicrobiia bacterium]|nr:MAG: ferritin [Acidimicrobiia bacterium]